MEKTKLAILFVPAGDAPAFTVFGTRLAHGRTAHINELLHECRALTGYLE